MKDLRKIPEILAINVLQLRNQQGWNQSTLAKKAQVPRTTLANIESGISNPSLSNLLRIANALGVSIEELLATPRPDCQLINKKDIPVVSKNSGKVLVSKLMPDKIKGIEMDLLNLEVGGILTGHPHVEGTKEYFTVLKGEFKVYISGDLYIVKKGDVLAFPGNQPHSYRNSGQGESRAISFVLPVPLFNDSFLSS